MLLSSFQNSMRANMYMSNAVKSMSGVGNSSSVAIVNRIGYNDSACYGNTNSGCSCVVIGAGDTPVDFDDYDLADSSIMASDKMKSLSRSATWNKNSGAISTEIWVNASNEPITVKEIGLTYKFNNGAYNKSCHILLARKVLSTPVTIQPGETYAFSYGVKI